MTLQELADRIRDASYLEGEFTLRSGRKSSFYVDKYLFETQPDILEEVGKRLADKVTPETTLIAGAELGGVALAAAAAMTAKLPFIIVRNTKKTMAQARCSRANSRPERASCLSRTSPRQADRSSRPRK